MGDGVGALLARVGAFDAVIDARSPAEFAQDHLPGAVSMPVLSDAERARVGTIYKQQSPFAARKLGGVLVARNVAAHVEAHMSGHDGGWRPLVYCWRGGQRSGAFATILRQIGWRVEVLEGGYQSWRRAVVGALYDRDLPHPLIRLDGNTGTGKTELLHRLAARGVQVLDLEGLAGHRGSVLGGMPGGQPAQKGFETALAAGLAALDPARPVVVEAESSRIGALRLPPALWRAMRVAPRVAITAPVPARAAYLAHAYRDVWSDLAGLCDRLEDLVPLQGRAQVDRWQRMAGDGRMEALAGELIERHYDPAYTRARKRTETEELATLRTGRLDPAALDRLAERVASLVDRFRPG